MKIKKIAPVLLFVVSCLLSVDFIWWHLQLGLVRYFDVDEFAHLHWTSQMLMGKKPYLDFLTFFPPGFWWFLAPLFSFGWGTTAPIIAARAAMFFVFAATAAVTGLLFWQMRRSYWLALFAAAILAFLPLPLDKTVEIRPDNLATLLLLLGVYFQVRVLLKKSEVFSGWASGFCYGASVVVLTKTVPVILPGVALAAWEWKRGREAINFFAGLSIPLLIVGLWALTLGDLGKVWYWLVQLPVEANRISQIFFMAPDLFFYPNGIFYGNNGWSRELLTNHALWIVGLLVGIYRLVVPFGKAEVFVAGTFLLQVVIYVQFIPLKHAQYLIAIAPFVAFYVADGILALYRKTPFTVFVFMFLLLSVYLFQTNDRINRPKLGWTNKEAIAYLEKLYTTVPKTEYILDLDGRTLYYPDPYYACCIPFGQFAPFLSQPLPSLADSLEKTKTKYIYQGQLKRVTTLLPGDQTYIAGHYEPVYGDEQLLVRKIGR